MSVFAEEEKKKEKIVKPAVQAKETVQRDLESVNGPEGGMLPESVSAKIQSKRGTGERLSDRNLQMYSQKFGRDMSDVHVHTDAESNTISRSLNARAFTIGSDVFLSNGINPDGGGRDAQTMAHELTHVVQQGGRASSGRLRLGAADTAQEHEAEATAQREYDPQLKEDNDTIQRGFWDTFGDKLADSFMGRLGLGDAYKELTGGSEKVRLAFWKLDDADKRNFDQLQEYLDKLEGKNGELEKAKNEAQAAKDRLVQTVKQTKKAQEESTVKGGTAVLDETEANQKAKAYNELYDDYEDARKQMLELLHKADETITQGDIDRYRTGGRRSAWTIIKASMAGSIMASFESDPQKRKEAAQKARESVINENVTRSFHQKAKFKTDWKHGVVKNGELYAVRSFEEMTQSMIGAVYDSLMKERKNRGLKLSKDRDTIIREIMTKQEFKPEKEKIRNKLISKISPTSDMGVMMTELEEAESDLAKVNEVKGKLNTTDRLDDFHTKILDNIEKQNKAIAEKKKSKAEDAQAQLVQLESALNELSDQKKVLEEGNVYRLDSASYKGSRKTIDDYVKFRKKALEDFLANPVYISTLLQKDDIEELKDSMRPYVEGKIEEVKKADKESSDPKAAEKKKADVIKAAWDKAEKEDELKSRYPNQLIFRSKVKNEFGTMIDDSIREHEEVSKIADAVISGLIAISGKKDK